MSRSKEVYAYQKMLGRCYSERSAQYKNYGARGIVVCEQWRASVAQFLADMGPAPSPAHSLERLDVDGNYCPENCVWATAKEQQRNRRNNLRVEWKGETRPLAEWCEKLGLSYARTHARLRKGQPVSVAFDSRLMPPGPNSRLRHQEATANA
jgi:hypothetical protein